MFHRRAAAGRLIGVALAGLLAAWLGAGTAEGGVTERAGSRVLAARVADPITPVIADHIAAGLARAAGGDYTAYVIELDTPGGLVTAMRDIVEDILASPVPVIVYVSPDGARAGSAGAFISFAAHVLVMAPGTTIGAATPVGLEGEEVPQKIVNDAASQAEALATLRGRDATFAVDTVRKGRSAAVDEALRLGVADARAATLTEALDVADGRKVTLVGQRAATVETTGAVVVRHDLGFLRRVLQKLADPNIAFLLLTLGTLGLIYELATPGVGVAGATGATALLLALFSLSVLPVNVVGVLLLLVAAGLFTAELFVPGTAGFAFGGAVVLALSGVFLFDDAEGISVDLAAVLPLAVVMFGAAVLAGRVAYRARHQPSTATGTDVFTGRVVLLAEASGETGRTFAEGAWWSVRSVGPPLAAGATARVVGIDGLVLLVDPSVSGTGHGAAGPAPGNAAHPPTKDTS
jgi:membrane-bound serine protease (ClpP class)